MSKHISTIRLGIFIFLGIAILVAAIFAIGGKNALFASKFKAKVIFQDIQGLKNGATVRFSGIDVGAVDDINIVRDNTGRIEVTLSLLKSIQHFIKQDSKASIETEGLVGNKIVVLKIGSDNAKVVEDGGYIISETPAGFNAIIAETKDILSYTKKMTKDLSEITERINKGEGTIGKLLNDPSLYDYAAGLTKRADSTLKGVGNDLNKISILFDKLGNGVNVVVGNVDRVVSNIDTILVGVKNGKGVIGKLIVDGSKVDTTLTNTLVNVERISSDTKLAASRLAENMEALKHNWLFKSYFEKRGYWEAGKYEEEIDKKIKELNDKIKLLDSKIDEIHKLEKK